jgi:hypothetical protein
LKDLEAEHLELNQYQVMAMEIQGMLCLIVMSEKEGSHGKTDRKACRQRGI